MIHRGLMLFFRWWVRQLAELVPSRLVYALAEAGEATILEVTGDRFGLSVRRRGGMAVVAEGPLADLEQTMASGLDLPALKLLRVPAAQVLRKRLTLPQAARRDLGNVLGYEIDRETPFEQAEVYWNYGTAASAVKGKLDIDLIVVPRKSGDALVAAAQAAGFIPAALEAAQEGRRSILLWLQTPNPLHYYRLPPKAKLPLAVIYGIAAAILVLPFAVQEARLFLAERTIASLKDQARAASTLNQAANRRIAALAFMNGSHLGEGGALEILAAASRALPDDSYLTSINVHDGQVTMAGSSEAAAKLIGALSASPAFRDPSFDAAVLQGDGEDLEKFTISAKLAAPSLAAGAP
jgi:general secretion pathway protein L